jgi:hypothetical protein
MRDSIRNERQTARECEPGRLALAADPGTPPDRLAQAVAVLTAEEEVTWVSRPSIKALAAHPNLPPSSLLPLLEKFVSDTLTGASKNPILPLIPLELPDFADRFSEGLARRVLNSSYLTTEFARLLIPHPDPMIRLMARTSRAIAGNVEPETDWRAELYPELRRLTNDLTKEQQMLLFELAEIGLYSSEILPETADPRDHVEAKLRYEVAQNNCDQAPPSMWHHWCVASDQHLKQLLECFRNDTWGISLGVSLIALTPETSPHKLTLLLPYADSVTRGLIRHHPHATDAIRRQCEVLAVQAAFRDPYGSPFARYGVLSRVHRVHKKYGTPGVWSVLFNEDDYGFLEPLGLAERMRFRHFGQFLPTLILAGNSNRYVVAACTDQNPTIMRLDRRIDAWLERRQKRKERSGTTA